MKNIFCLILIFCCIFFIPKGLICQNKVSVPLNKQISNFELGKRYLKLGNTWREAGEFDLAQKYLTMGFNIITKYNDKYQLGVYYEYLGYYFKDKDDLKNALINFEKARNIYNKYAKTKDNTGSNKAINSLVNNLGKKEISKDNNTQNYQIAQDNIELKEKELRLTNKINELNKKVLTLENQIQYNNKKIDSLNSLFNENKPITGPNVFNNNQIEKNVNQENIVTIDKAVEKVNNINENDHKNKISDNIISETQGTSETNLDIKKPDIYEIDEAVRNSLKREVPVAWVGHLMGGKNAVVKKIEVQKWGIFNEKSQYWPIKIRVVGTAEINDPFTKGKKKDFDRIADYIFFQDDYGIWKAELKDGLFQGILN